MIAKKTPSKDDAQVSALKCSIIGRYCFQIEIYRYEVGQI
jgi:hypothetical protein